MATDIEITKINFTSDYNNLFKLAKIAIEDCKFITFADLLDETDVISTPVVSRANGIYKNAHWSILGYCCESYIKSSEDEFSVDRRFFPGMSSTRFGLDKSVPYVIGLRLVKTK